MANSERLHAVLEHIKTLPKRIEDAEPARPTTPMWDQSVWLTLPDTMIEGQCGTAGCFAGWALMLFGPKFKTEFHQGQHMIYNVIVEGEEESTPIESLARDILDLNWNEGDILFNQDNSIEDLEDIIRQIENGEHPDEYEDQ